MDKRPLLLQEASKPSREGRRPRREDKALKVSGEVGELECGA